VQLRNLKKMAVHIFYFFMCPTIKETNGHCSYLCLKTSTQVKLSSDTYFLQPLIYLGNKHETSKKFHVFVYLHCWVGRHQMSLLNTSLDKHTTHFDGDRNKPPVTSGFGFTWLQPGLLSREASNPLDQSRRSRATPASVARETRSILRGCFDEFQGFGNC